MPLNQSIDKNKSRKQLIKELAKMRNQLAAGKHQCRKLTQELSRPGSEEWEKTEEVFNQKNLVLEGINRIFQQALICETEEKLGELCLKVAEEITGSKFGFIGEISEQGRLDDIAISDPGWKACQMADPQGHRVLPTGIYIRGIYGKVLKDGKGFYTNNPGSHPDSIGLPDGHPSLEAFLGVPLVQGGKAIVGMVGVANRPGGYRKRDLDALEALAPAIVQALLSRRAEIKVSHQKDLLQHIFDNIPVLLIMWNAQFNGYFLNCHAENVLGWTTAEANKSDFMKKLYPKSAYRNRVAAYMESLEPGWREWKTATKKGKFKPIEWANISISDGTRIGIGIDMSEHTEAIQALRESEKRLRMAIDAAYIISFEWDIPRNEVRRFKSSEPALGPTADDKFETFEDIVKVVYPDDRKLFKNNVQAALERKDGKYESEFRFVRPNGEIVWIYECGCIERDTEGQPLRLIGLSKDITQRKQVEEEIRQLNETLEQKVAERTKLSEARAKQLQNLAVELIEAEERERQRIAEMLHEDLQQILASAKMQLQLACHKVPRNPELVAVMKMLEESIKKSRQLSHDLNPPPLQHFGLIPALDWLFHQMENQFGLKIMLELNTRRQFKNESLKIFMFRSVQELLFNVVKHSGVKKACVKLFEVKDALVITIRDQGRGFNPEILESLNVKTGLGLACIRERARAIGGDLKVESAPGDGCKCILTIPCRFDKAIKPEGTEEAANYDNFPPGSESAVKASLRVLFVDDHKVMRQGLISMISGQPEIQAVGEAGNGAEAVEKVQQLHPDVVVMDVSMPKMDGVEATRRIKAKFPKIRVIGLSMYEDEQTKRSMLEAGAEKFVRKTASPSELLKAIYRIKH